MNYGILIYNKINIIVLYVLTFSNLFFSRKFRTYFGIVGVLCIIKCYFKWGILSCCLFFLYIGTYFKDIVCDLLRVLETCPRSADNFRTKDFLWFLMILVRTIEKMVLRSLRRVAIIPYRTAPLACKNVLPKWVLKANGSLMNNTHTI